MPAVTVAWKPSGLPIATTSWPTRRRDERAELRRAAGRSPASRSTARSVAGSSPISRAGELAAVGQAGRELGRAGDHVAVGDADSRPGAKITPEPVPPRPFWPARRNVDHRRADGLERVGRPGRNRDRAALPATPQHRKPWPARWFRKRTYTSGLRRLANRRRAPSSRTGHTGLLPSRHAGSQRPNRLKSRGCSRFGCPRFPPRRGSAALASLAVRPKGCQSRGVR